MLSIASLLVYLCVDLGVGRRTKEKLGVRLLGAFRARVIFYISNGEMILLHGFIKKSQKTPKKEIDLAVKRQKEHQKYER